MSTELLFSVLVFVGFTVLRLGIPLLALWMLSKGLRYLQTALP
jgi:hypothetical protein